MAKKVLLVSVAMLVKDIGPSGFKLWMQKRSEEGPLHGLWEFPGGKIEAEESPEEAMIREVQEEVELSIKDHRKKRLFKIYPYTYQDRMISLYTYFVEAHPDWERTLEQKGEWFEVSYKKQSSPLQEVIPAANVPIINELCDYLSKNQLLDVLWN